MQLRVLRRLCVVDPRRTLRFPQIPRHRHPHTARSFRSMPARTRSTLIAPINFFLTLSFCYRFMCHLSMLYIVFLSTHASMPSREGELLDHMLDDGHLLKNRRGNSPYLLHPRVSFSCLVVNACAFVCFQFAMAFVFKFFADVLLGSMMCVSRVAL